MVLPAVEGGHTYTQLPCCLRHRKGDASFASAYRSFRIRSGDCLLPIKSPAYAHFWLLDARSRWTSLRGTGQLLQSIKDAGELPLYSNLPTQLYLTRLAYDGE